MAASAQERTKARTAGLLGQPAGVARPSSSTWPASGLKAVKRLSASPPNIWQTAQGPIWTSSPAAWDASTIRPMVSR